MTSYNIYIFINQCFKHPIYTVWVIKSYRPRKHPSMPRSTEAGDLRSPESPQVDDWPSSALSTSGCGTRPGRRRWTSAWSGAIFRKFISSFAPFISILVSNAFISDRIWIPVNLDSSWRFGTRRNDKETTTTWWWNESTWFSDRVVQWELLVPFRVRLHRFSKVTCLTKAVTSRQGTRQRRPRWGMRRCPTENRSIETRTSIFFWCHVSFLGVQKI